MLFETTLRKIFAKQDKRKLILETVAALRIDEKQKELYREAVEILDAQGLESLYRNLAEVMRKIDAQSVKAEFSTNQPFVGIRRKEAETRIREERSAAILLENI